MTDITHRFQFIEGTPELENIELVCIPKHKYRQVLLAMKEGASMSFAEIKLYDTNLFTDADATFESATILGEEIAKRFNEWPKLAKEPIPILRPEDQYHEDMGPVLWYTFPVEEPPYVGSPLDSDWPGGFTHFMPLPSIPEQICRVCGCTDNNCSGCIERTGHPCHWVEDDLCSACADQKGDEEE